MVGIWTCDLLQAKIVLLVRVIINGLNTLIYTSYKCYKISINQRQQKLFSSNAYNIINKIRYIQLHVNSKKTGKCSGKRMTDLYLFISAYSNKILLAQLRLNFTSEFCASTFMSVNFWKDKLDLILLINLFFKVIRLYFLLY